MVHGDISHSLADAGAAAKVAAVKVGTDRSSHRAVDVVPRNIHPVGAVLDIRFSPSRAFPSRTIHLVVNPAPPMPKANPSSSDYETHGLGLVGPAVGLDGVKILMILKTTMLEEVEVVVIVVLVLSVSLRALDDAVLKAVVVVDIMVYDDAALRVVVRVDVIAIARALGGAVKELEEGNVEVVVMETGGVVSAAGRAMEVVDGRIAAVVVVRMTTRLHACHHHWYSHLSSWWNNRAYGSNFGTDKPPSAAEGSTV